MARAYSSLVVLDTIFHLYLNETVPSIIPSGANTRVKVHSQVHFGLWIKILNKKLGTSFILRDFMPKKWPTNFVLKISLVQANLYSQKIVGKKNFGSKYLG